MAPRPTTSVIWYLPIRSICAIRGLLFEHLHRLSDAFLHAVEGVGERADLVPGAQMEVGDVHVAHADLVGELRQPGHRHDDHRKEHRIEDNADEEEDAGIVLNAMLLSMV